jgi:hypothetical protein
MSEIDTPPGISAVLRELDAIHATMRENRELVKGELVAHRVVVKAEMDTRFSVIEEKQDEQLTEARITNGRVRRLEIGYAVMKAAVSAFVLLTPFIVWYLSNQ